MNSQIRILLALMSVLTFQYLSAQTIEPISVSLKNPTGICISTSGDMFVADNGNHFIKKISTNGAVTVIAGTGNAGYSGDGGLATQAEINFPYRLCIDQSSNIYFTDQQNNVVRKISPNGIITTIAGNGTAGFSGDEGLATEAQLNNPLGICIDASGNLFIADAFNQRIRKVDPQGIITTIAGTGPTASYNGAYSGDGGQATEARLNIPAGITIDASGVIYISEQGNSVVRKISSNGIITTIAGDGVAGYSGDGGQATQARLNTPLDIVVDTAGNVFITEDANYRIRKISPSGTISTLSGNGTQNLTPFTNNGSISSPLGNPNGIAITSGGEIIVADNGKNQIYKIEQ